MFEVDAAVTVPHAHGSTNARVFWLRMVDNLFRRRWLFALPIVLFTLLGVLQASRTQATYMTSSVLSATSNPLVADQGLSGASSSFWETPAASTSRQFNEQLRTDSFTTDLAEGAGLGDAIESGLLTLDAVRASVWASAGGDTLLTLHGVWNDPQTSFALVESSWNTYTNYIADEASRLSREAEEYYRNVLAEAEEKVAAAEAAYSELLAGLPDLEPGELRSAEDQVQIERLSDRLSAAEDEVSDAQALVDQSVLAGQQARSKAGQTIQIIDEPKLPTSPESSLQSSVVSIGALFLFGIVVSTIALVVTTMVQRTVTVPAQLEAVDEITLVATTPPLRHGKRRQRRKSREGTTDERPPTPPSPDAEAFSAQEVSV